MFHSQYISNRFDLCLAQLGEEPENVTAAERARWKAIESKDEEALLQANSELIAAMLHCQYGEVSLDAEKAKITIQVCPSLQQLLAKLTPASPIAQNSIFCNL
jgi:hypothetical protein